jgi:signal transduction histidine kinase
MAWSTGAAVREHRADLATQSQIVAATTAAYINRDLEALDAMAGRLASMPAVRTLEPSGSADLLSGAIGGRASLLALLLVDANGYEVTRVDSSTEPLDVAGWSTRVLQDRARVVEPLRVTSSGLRYVILAYPVVSEGAVEGALGMVVNVATLHEAFGRLPLPDSTIVSIADARGRILTQNVDAERTAGQLLYGRARSGGGPIDRTEYMAPDGIRRLHVEAVAEAGPWFVSVGVPLSAASDRALLGWRQSSLALAIGLAGCFMVSWFFSRRLSVAVGHLDAGARRIAAGDFTVVERPHVPTLSAEFAQLQGAFDSMLQRFNDTRGALDAQMLEERRIRQELESLQGQVIRQERLAAVGQLVSGVAHEINNPLQAILGFAELLQMQADVPESVKDDLRLIQKESARACAIIRNLAMFARQQPGEAAPLVLAEVISAVAELRQRRLQTEDIELRIEDRARQPVKAVLTELQQVVLNFVVNAEQAILLSGRLPGRITIRAFDNGGRVTLEVEDTGPGIPPENEAKLFQPFFTTKPVGQGTGLGLSISYGIIDSLGGTIGYRRAPAGGSIFFFDLPAASEADGPVPGEIEGPASGKAEAPARPTARYP